MSKHNGSIAPEPMKNRPLLLRRGQVKERFLIINQDWLIPLQSLQRLHSNSNTENELESISFPNDESFTSHWQLYIEHQAHPSRIRIGLTLLEPHNLCIRADIKLVCITTHGGQVIKETFFPKHRFFLSKGDAMSSYINDHISPKVYLDIEDDLYEKVVDGTQKGNLLDANDYTIVGYVRFINDYEIEPKPKVFDLSRRLTVDWKLVKFRHIIEQLNQTRAPAGNHGRRILSDRFQFTHVNMNIGVLKKKWKLILTYPRTPSNNKHTPFYATLKFLDESQSNYGKFEIICENEHHILRRYIDSIEDLNDHYTIEFFTLDEMCSNIYQYKQNFDKNNGRCVTVDYILLTIQIIQPLQGFDVLKKLKRIAEPTIISLNSLGKARNKKEELLSKSLKEQPKKSPSSENKKLRSPVSPEKTFITSASWDDPAPINNHVLPPIRLSNNSSIRRNSSSSLQMLPNIGEHQPRSSRLFMYKPIRSNPPSSALPSASSTTLSDLTDNFTFLTNLFRSGLHSDIIIRHHDREWNLHKSILSSRSIYFNQYFAKSKVTELNLTDDHEIKSSIILDKMFLFIYTNQYSLEKLPRLSLFEANRLLFDLSIKFGIDTLTRRCLQDMCNSPNLNINTAAYLLLAINQAIQGTYEKYHSNDYLMQIKSFKQNILRFIQLNSREVLLSPEWKALEKHHPYLIHDVLEFVVFEKISE